METAEERREREAEERKQIEETYRENESYYKRVGMSIEDYLKRSNLSCQTTSDDSEDESKARREDVQPPWVPQKDYLDLICNRCA